VNWPQVWRQFAMALTMVAAVDLTLRAIYAFARYAAIAELTGDTYALPSPGTSSSTPGTTPGIDKPKSKRSGRVYTWTCQYCGQPFETQEYSKRYCSGYHKKLASEARRAP